MTLLRLRFRTLQLLSYLLDPSDHHQWLGKQPYILAPNKSSLCRIASLLAFSYVFN